MAARRGDPEMGITVGHVLNTTADKITPKVIPTMALVFYSVNDRLAVLEHTIESTERGAVIGAGRALTASGVHGMLAKIVGQRESNGFLPEGLLVNDPGVLAWVVPGQVRSMWFKGKATASKPRRVLVPWPTLLFVVRDGSLSIAALDGPGRPRLDAKVFHAPLMNIYGSGAICLGSNTSTRIEGVESMSHWEKVVFDSAFTHVNHGRTLVVGKKGENVDDDVHLRFWTGLMRSKAKVFPAKALAPFRGTTVKAFIFSSRRDTE
jgi:PRTRC genetic system protein B